MTRTLYPAAHIELKTASDAGRKATDNESAHIAATSIQLCDQLAERLCLACVEVRRLQHVVHSLGMHPKRAPDPDCGQLAVVDKPVDGHFADPHQGCHLGYREKLSSGRLAVGRSGVPSRFTAS